MKLYFAILLLITYTCLTSEFLYPQSYYTPITDQGITSTTHRNNIGKTQFYGLGLKSIPVDCADYGK